MSTAAGTVEITDAQRARAAANKAAALARRAAREAQTPPPPQPPPSANSHVLSHFVPRASVVRATEGRHAPQHMPSTTTTTTVIAPDRMRRLNFLQTNLDGGFVLLWVQSAQRARHNETLEYAAQRASAIKKPLVAVFAGTGNFPHANERHLGFMYDGLCELRKTLENTRNITLLGCGVPKMRAKSWWTEDIQKFCASGEKLSRKTHSAFAGKWNPKSSRPFIQQEGASTEPRKQLRRFGQRYGPG